MNIGDATDMTQSPQAPAASHETVFLHSIHKSYITWKAMEVLLDYYYKY